MSNRDWSGRVLRLRAELILATTVLVLTAKYNADIVPGLNLEKVDLPHRIAFISGIWLYLVLHLFLRALDEVGPTLQRIKACLRLIQFTGLIRKPLESTKREIAAANIPDNLEMSLVRATPLVTRVKQLGRAATGASDMLSMVRSDGSRGFNEGNIRSELVAIKEAHTDYSEFMSELADSEPEPGQHDRKTGDLGQNMTTAPILLQEVVSSIDGIKATRRGAVRLLIRLALDYQLLSVWGPLLACLLVFLACWSEVTWAWSASWPALELAFGLRVEPEEALSFINVVDL